MHCDLIESEKTSSYLMLLNHRTGYRSGDREVDSVYYNYYWLPKRLIFTIASFAHLPCILTTFLFPYSQFVGLMLNRRGHGFESR